MRADGRLRTADLTPRDCATCSTTFTPMRRSKGIYCSRRCANAGIARSTISRRADLLRDRGDRRTYRKLNGRHEHRIVAEKMLGRPLLPGEIVHHIDGDFRNNAPENLAVMTQGEHIRLHDPRGWRSR